jgi:hypothetical protein
MDLPFFEFGKVHSKLKGFLGEIIRIELAIV